MLYFAVAGTMTDLYFTTCKHQGATKTSVEHKNPDMLRSIFCQVVVKNKWYEQPGRYTRVTALLLEIIHICTVVHATCNNWGFDASDLGTQVYRHISISYSEALLCFADFIARSPPPPSAGAWIETHYCRCSRRRIWRCKHSATGFRYAGRDRTLSLLVCVCVGGDADIPLLSFFFFCGHVPGLYLRFKNNKKHRRCENWNSA